MSAYKIQTPGNHPEENIQHTEHGGSLKSKTTFIYFHNISFVTLFAYITPRNLIKNQNEHSLFYPHASEYF
jgi:hypothetical protein